MPATGRDLQWLELTEFGGLWTNGGKFLMPTKNAQVMSGCYPQKSGGLRAFYQPVIEASGAGMPATDRAIRGFGVIPDALNSLDQNIGNRYFLLTSGPDATDYKLYRKSNIDAGDPTWTAVTTGATFDGQTMANEIAHPGFVRYALSISVTGLNLYYLEVNTIGVGAGLYLLSGTPTGNTLTAVTVHTGALYHGPLLQHQGRLLLGTDNGVTFTTFSGTDLSTIPPAGAIVPGGDGLNKLVAASRHNRIAWLLTIPPADLLLGMMNGTIYNVQGDLSDPVIRDLGQWGRTLPQEPVNTAHGSIIIFPRLGPQIFTSDGRMSNMSTDLDPDDWDLPGITLDRHFGSSAAAEQYYYGPNLMDLEAGGPTLMNNGALVFDFGTNSWFTSVHPDVQRMVSPRWIRMATGRFNPGVFVASGELTRATTAAVISRYPAGVSGQIGYAPDPAPRRAWKYEWKGAPLRSPDGREVAAEELQVGTLGLHESGGTITATVTNELGEAFSQAIPVPVGKTTHILPLDLRGEYLEVSFVSEANHHDYEAPILEGFRLGWRPGHRNGVVT